MPPEYLLSFSSLWNLTCNLNGILSLFLNYPVFDSMEPSVMMNNSSFTNSAASTVLYRLMKSRNFHRHKVWLSVTPAAVSWVEEAAVQHGLGQFGDSVVTQSIHEVSGNDSITSKHRDPNETMAIT